MQTDFSLISTNTKEKSLIRALCAQLFWFQYFNTLPPQNIFTWPLQDIESDISHKGSQVYHKQVLHQKY